MASLTTHLRRSQAHGRLAFHPECPICRRERVSGSLPSDAILSRRSQALLAAGVLALSSATPAVVLAAEPDQEQEGATAPEQNSIDNGRSAPDLDPGGPPTELPLDAGPADDTAPAPDLSGEAISSEPVPAASEDVPAADAEGGIGAADADELPKTPESEPLPAPAASETGVPEAQPVPAPNAPLAEAPVVTRQEPQVDGAPAARDDSSGAAEQLSRASKPGNSREAPGRSHAVEPMQASAATPPLQPEPIAVRTVSASTTSQAVPSVSVSASTRQVARRADRFHVVQRGESLWTISKDLLGDEASVAQIAREVNRLWELNSARIGTGEPDLLMVGTRIAMR